ncbi:hypothetical protein FB451DRAFT_1179940 [Mycena latifolia]|nr:hypothetical protein FB451DRAFT_1179940 [Mycena latifolia]
MVIRTSFREELCKRLRERCVPTPRRAAPDAHTGLALRGGAPHAAPPSTLAACRARHGAAACAARCSRAPPGDTSTPAEEVAEAAQRKPKLIQRLKEKMHVGHAQAISGNYDDTSFYFLKYPADVSVGVRLDA